MKALFIYFLVRWCLFLWWPVKEAKLEMDRHSSWTQTKKLFRIWGKSNSQLFSCYTPYANTSGACPKQYHNPVSQGHSHGLRAAPEFTKPRVMKASAPVSSESDQSFIAPRQPQQRRWASVSFHRTCHIHSPAIPHWAHLSSPRLFALGFLTVPLKRSRRK